MFWVKNLSFSHPERLTDRLQQLFISTPPPTTPFTLPPFFLFILLFLLNKNIMSNIFNRLPFEINCVIFSLLDQHSCLESIKVCHTWFEQVPRHSTSLWKQVDFYYIWTKSNPCLLKCLGSHVREIIVSYHSLDILMTQLKLHCHCYNISSIGK